MNNTIEQEKVIGYEEGNAVINSCAGSGKTHTLIQKIKKNSYRKNGVLSLCFTLEVKNEIKERFALEKINTEINEIKTIDAFFSRIIELYWPIIEEFENIDSIEFEIISDINYLFIEYEEWKKRLFNGQLIINSKKQWHKLFVIYELSRNNELRNKVEIMITENYHSIYVDEYQDLVPEDLKLIEFFDSIENINIFFFGDLNQSIYKWRGVEIKRIIKLTKNFKEFKLDKNFRCKKEINDIANKLLNPNLSKEEIDEILINENNDYYTLLKDGIDFEEIENYQEVHSPTVIYTGSVEKINLSIKKYIESNKLKDLKLNYKRANQSILGLTDLEFSIFNYFFDTNYATAIEEQLKEIISENKAKHLMAELENGNINLFFEKLGIDPQKLFNLFDTYHSEEENGYISLASCKGKQYKNVIFNLKSWVLKTDEQNVKYDKDTINNLYVALTRTQGKIMIVWD